MIALLSTWIVAASFGDNIAGLIKGIIGPIAIAVAGIMAINFLVHRQLMQFIIFLILAIGVAAVIYAPGFIKNVGEGAGNNIKWSN